MKKDKEKEFLKAIDEYLSGKMSPADQEEFWATMLENPQYYKWFKTEATIKKHALKNARSKAKPFTRFLFLFDHHPVVSTGIAALLVIAIALSLFLFLQTNNNASYLEQIPAVNLIAPEIQRSAAHEYSPLQIEMQNAFTLALSEEREEARELYKLLREEHPEASAAISFNLGILHYNQGDFKQAVRFFAQTDCTFAGKTGTVEDSRSPAHLEASCYWFKANSLVASGKYKEAKQAASEVTEMGGAYAQDAQDLLDQLGRSF